MVGTQIWTDISSLKVARRDAVKCTAVPRHPFGADAVVYTGQSAKKNLQNMYSIYALPQIENID
jgi:hypothetical protein